LPHHSLETRHIRRLQVLLFATLLLAASFSPLLASAPPGISYTTRLSKSSYAQGENVYASVTITNNRNTAVTLVIKNGLGVIKDPDGKEVYRTTQTSDYQLDLAAGHPVSGSTSIWTVPSDAKPGKYTAEWSTDVEVVGDPTPYRVQGSETFQVTQYTPPGEPPSQPPSQPPASGKEASSITCWVYPTSVPLNASVMVSGMVFPAVFGFVTITLVKPDGGNFSLTTTTRKNGDYYLAYTPMQPGTWYVKASWNGSSEFLGAETPLLSFNVTRLTSGISLVVGNASVRVGGLVNLSGRVTPVRAGVAVRILASEDNASFSEVSTAETGVDGGYTLTILAVNAGVLYLKASWDGDPQTMGAESIVAWVEVLKIPTTLSIVGGGRATRIGEPLLVEGFIEPPVQGSNVTIIFTAPNGSSILIFAETNASGWFMGAITPDRAGSWAVSATWAGGPWHLGSSSEPSDFVVNKIETSLTLSTGASVTLGNPVNVKGGLTPPVARATVEVVYRLQGGSTVTSSVVTFENGSFTDAYTPDREGDWSVQARWNGDEKHLGSESSAVSFTVARSPVLEIVLAAAGASAVAGVAVSRAKRRGKKVAKYG